MRLPRAVLWDLDGTLVDTEPYWDAAEQRVVEAAGGVWTAADTEAVVGWDLLDAANYMRQQTGITLPAAQIVTQMVDDVAAACRRQLRWQPGARELLLALHRLRVPLALVTMSYSTLAGVVLEQLPSNIFAVVVTGDVVSQGKPHPEPYQQAAAQLGVDPSYCMALEDSRTGAASALAAGTAVVLVPSQEEPEAHPRQVVLPNLIGQSPRSLSQLWDTLTSSTSNI